MALTVLKTDVPETDAPETDVPETDASETDVPETDLKKQKTQTLWKALVGVTLRLALNGVYGSAMCKSV